MHHVRQILSAALLSLGLCAGCDWGWDVGDPDIQVEPQDRFDTGSYTVGELDQARFQLGTCAPLLLGPCDLVMPLMTGHHNTLFVDVTRGDPIGDVESSEPDVLAATHPVVTEQGYVRLDLDALAPGDTTLLLKRDDGSLLDYVTIEVRPATDLRWAIVAGDEAEPTEHDGAGELTMAAGHDVVLVVRPIDATGRIVNGFGDGSAGLVDGDDAVQVTAALGSYLVGLDALAVGPATLRLGVGEVEADITISVTP